MHDIMLDKIRKLLAKADDPAASEHEERLYTDKALRLMAQYGIDQALVTQHSHRTDGIADRVITIPKPYATDKLALLATIAVGMRCRVVQRTRYPDGVKELSAHVFGHQNDLRLVEILYTSLLVQAMHGLARTPVPSGHHAAAFRRSWLAGFAQSIGERLTAASADARDDADSRDQDGPTAAVVLADHEAQVSDAVNTAYPRLGQARQRRRSGGGLAAGARAGKSAHLGDTRDLRAQQGPDQLPA